MKKRLKERDRIVVLLIVPSLSTGGGEKLVFELAKGVDRSRFEINVVSLYGKQCNNKEKVIEDIGIKIYYLNKSPGFDFRTLLKLRRLVNKINPNVIHSHLDVLIYLLPCYKRNQIKLHTVHSMASFEASGVHRIVRIFAFKVLKVIPVAIGETVRKSIAQQYGINEQTIPCIYNGAPLPKITNSKITNESNKFVIISVGTLYRIKNYELLINAVSICINESNLDIELRIVGDGEDREKLNSLIKELGMEESIKLLGWRENVYEELKKADVYVCSSLIEGVSISIIEAMMMGLPIIASNVGANPDLVKDGVNGILFESENIIDLKKAIIRLVEDSEYRHLLAEGAYSESSKFDIKNCVKKYEQLYKAKQ